MTLIEDTVLIKLQKFDEKFLTENILIPLLCSLGYYKVYYHGGPYEEGKDLICWRNDELGQTELAVAQVKRYKPSARASDNQSFMEVVNQLQVASETPVPFTDGQPYTPTIVYFITPYQVETRALKTRFEKFKSLRSHGIKIVDGPLLLQLLKKHLPDMANELYGFKMAVHGVSTKELNNRTLLKALDFKTEKKISTFYSELNIIFGNIASRLFFQVEFSKKYYRLSLPELEWEEFKNTCKYIEKNFKISLLKRSAAEITKEYAEKKKFLKSNKREIDEGPDEAIDETLIIDLDVTQLVAFFVEKRSWLIEQIADLNKNETSTDKCLHILLDCHKLFKSADKLVRDKYISLILNFIQNDNINNGKIGKIPRIKIAVNKIIDTGISIGIFGEAGAGKTTCLQMQAKRFLTEKGKTIFCSFYSSCPYDFKLSGKFAY
jgi:hypothetical protein